jgi:hypothetical protein
MTLPERKVTVGMLAGSIVTLFASFYELTAEQTGALVVLVTFALSYIVPNPPAPPDEPQLP